MHRTYGTGPVSHQFVSEEVEKILDNGIIEPAQSEWASSFVVASKADGSLRFCIYCPRLNTMTIRDEYPLLRMDKCI